ncbi:peptidylprolyl isomerase [Pajaroellobacter abortibovis]|nr:SurA N-terminal domain-containing protein [Pajaroellobacter abortibovis]
MILLKKAFPLIALVFFALFEREQTGEAAIVERIVAVVGEEPIWFTDLNQRARPDLMRMAAAVQDPAQVTAASSEIYRAVLDRMITEHLEFAFAKNAHIAVTLEEVDRALGEIAQRARLSIPELLVEAQHIGLTEQEYREEFKRQLLEGKLVQLRVRERVRVTEQDAHAAYRRFLKEIGEEPIVEFRVLALRLSNGEGGATVLEDRRALAYTLLERARAGEDFCALVEAYSDDFQTKQTCGSRGLQPVKTLIPVIQRALEGMKEGEVSDPVMDDPEAILILQLVHEPGIPSYESLHDQMLNRAFQKEMEQQLKAWREELKRGVYIDVRL